jgi:hypothetical protein
VAWTLDLGPLVRLQKEMWRIACFTGTGVYFQAIATLVLVQESALSLPAVGLVAVILIVQLLLIYHPARQLGRRELARRHQAFIALAPVFVATTSLGSAAGEQRIVAAFLSALVAALGVWAAAGAIRVTAPLLSGYRSRLRPVSPAIAPTHRPPLSLRPTY